MNHQNILRKKIQALRMSLSNQQQQVYSQQICQTLIISQLLKKAEHIVIYLPIKGEANPTLLMTLEQLKNKQFYLPVLSKTKEKHLAFAPYNELTVMTTNRFNIPEPDMSESDLIQDPIHLDCIIMPLVGIDLAGNRIGMGGGFYDRTFSYKKDKKKKPLLIGFAYDFQILSQQVPNDWDVPADAIVTQTIYKQL